MRKTMAATHTAPRRSAPAQTAARKGPPSEVTLCYQEIGKTHVFTAPELPGLRIGSADLRDAFDSVSEGVQLHVFALYDRQVDYTLATDFAHFQKALKRARSGHVTMRVVRELVHA